MSDYSELLTRIRSRPNDAPMPTEHMLDDAADAIEALQTECERLREAGVGYSQQTVDAITTERERLRDVLLRNGFVPCDIAACNCESWHHRFGYPERFREIEELLQDNDISTNGVTLLSAIKALVEERNRLRAVNAEQAVWIDTAVANCAKRECSKRDEQLRDLRDELAAAQERLDAVREIYAGMDGFIPQTAAEAYCLRIIREMAYVAMAQEKRDE